MNQRADSAVVLLSGGLDSATVLAMAVAQGLRCYALSIDYGQRHLAELDAAAKVAAVLGAAEHRVVRLDVAQFGGSALTDRDIDVPEGGSEGIPITYVPARNTMMLAIALAWAEVLNAQQIHVGVNAVDYSGYPDCRPEFIEQFERLAQLATRVGVEGAPIEIKAPLMAMTKAEIVQAGDALGFDYSVTVSCYAAKDDGRACGRCDACRLRRDGFIAAGMADPTRYVDAG